VTDASLRDLERRFRASGSVEDEAMWLRARAQAGELPERRLKLAARLGDPASQVVLPAVEPFPRIALSPAMGRSVREGEALVAVTEEYGYRRWLWLPGMTPEELEDWWRALPSVEPYFRTPKPLPGAIVQVKALQPFDQIERIGAFHSAHVHQDDDSQLRAPGGAVVRHAGWCG
jgi:hypothetical protein